MDREFYVVQSEIYADESPDGILEYNYQKGMDETPTMVCLDWAVMKIHGLTLCA